jgi:hypothetical protein
MSTKTVTRSPRKKKSALSKEVTALAKSAAPSNGKRKKATLNGVNGNHTNGHSQDYLSDDRYLLEVLTEVKNGNFSVRMPIDREGLGGKICDTINDIISLNEKMMLEFTKAGNTIGKQGKLTQRIEVPNAKGLEHRR